MTQGVVVLERDLRLRHEVLSGIRVQDPRPMYRRLLHRLQSRNHLKEGYI